MAHVQQVRGAGDNYSDNRGDAPRPTMSRGAAAARGGAPLH